MDEPGRSGEEGSEEEDEREKAGYEEETLEGGYQQSFQSSMTQIPATFQNFNDPDINKVSKLQ